MKTDKDIDIIINGFKYCHIEYDSNNEEALPSIVNIIQGIVKDREIIGICLKGNVNIDLILN